VEEPYNFEERIEQAYFANWTKQSHPPTVLGGGNHDTCQTEIVHSSLGLQRYGYTNK